MKQIAVAAAVIENEQGDILIAKRSDDQHQGGLWEFPGGKIEEGESVEQALVRELDEELGIQVSQASPLIRIHHQYPDKSVLLDVWRVTQFAGQPEGKEGQPIRWVASDSLDSYPFPAANHPIITAAQLPDQIQLIDQTQPLFKAEQRLINALKRGCRWFMLRDLELDINHLRVAYEHLRIICNQHGAQLIICSDPLTANELQAEALFLTASHLIGLSQRSEFSGRWLGAACHNPGELLMAQQKGCDFISLSPVKSLDLGLGWTRFAELTEIARVPVYARGGLNKDDLSTAQQMGAQGVIVRAPDA